MRKGSSPLQTGKIQILADKFICIYAVKICSWFFEIGIIARLFKWVNCSFECCISKSLLMYCILDVFSGWCITRDILFMGGDVHKWREEEI